MKERPILFTSPMVNAILDGRKTQTRRAVQPVGNDGGFVMLDHGNGWWPYRSDDGESSMHTVKKGDKLYLNETPHSCPYGNPGDRLWVRETWRIGAWDCDTGGIAVDYKASDTARREWLKISDDIDGEKFDRYWQQSCADCEAAGLHMTTDGGWKWEPGQSPCRWRPSIHMPRWASRILLEVVSVRIGRLQDISEDDAKAEGCYQSPRYPQSGLWTANDNSFSGSAIDCYHGLWLEINGLGSWAENPWVWVIEFRTAA